MNPPVLKPSVRMYRTDRSLLLSCMMSRILERNLAMIPSFEPGAILLVIVLLDLIMRVIL